MNTEFISTVWFKITISFVLLVIYTIIILKAEEKSRRKENEILYP